MKNLSPDQIDRIGIKVANRMRKGNTSGALKILQDNGFEEEARSLEHPTEPMVDHDLRCPAHHATVKAPCKLDGCKFWVPSDIANRCLLAYAHQQKVDQLSGDEIAYLYGQHVDTVKAELESAMLRLRQTAIQSDAAHDPDIERVFWFVETNKICCVCGSTTENGGIAIPETPLAYCSKECAEEMPADQLACEYRFGRPIQTIIRWAIRRFRNLPVLERTLGLKRETLIELCRRHLGRDLSAFFPKVKIQSERPLWRRRINRSELLEAQQAIKDLTIQQTKRAGHPIFKIADLRERLNNVLS